MFTTTVHGDNISLTLSTVRAHGDQHHALS